MPHIKRSLLTGLVIILFAVGAGYAITLPAHAQSTAAPTDTQTLLDQLWAQLAVLQQKIVDLGGAPIETPPALAANRVSVRPVFSEGRAPSSSAQSCMLTRTLSFGARGDEVVCLQLHLISEGLLTEDSVTGYFGRLTQAAVQRYQAQNNIVSEGDPTTTGYGAVGPRTRNAMTTVDTSSQAGISSSNGTDDYAPDDTDTPVSVSSSSSPPSSSRALTITSAPDTAQASYDDGLSSIDALLQQLATEQNDIDTSGVDDTAII